LNDEPVQACPPSAWYRFRKLAQRNRRAFVSTAAASLVMVLAVVALTVGFLHVKQERDAKEEALGEKETALAEKEKALGETVRQKNLAEFHLGLARKAVHNCLTSVGQNRGLKTAEFHDLRKALLAPSVNILMALELNYKDDPSLQGELADVYSDLAFLRQEMGEQEQALKEYDRRREIVARLAKQFPRKYQYRLALADANHGAANILCDLGRRHEAEPLFNEALSLQKQVILEGHEAPGNRLNLALGHIAFGALCSNLEGRQREALAHYNEAMTLLRPLVQEFPKVADYREGLAGTFTNRAKLFLEMKQFSEAADACWEAITLQKKLGSEFPDQPEYRQQLAMSYGNLGQALARRRKLPEAEKATGDAIAIQDKLVIDFPRVPQYRQELARSYTNLGSLLVSMRKLADATARLRQALLIYEGLCKNFPKVPEYTVELAHTYNNMGRLTITTRPDAALPWYTKAIAALEPVLAKEATLLTARETLSRAHWGRAECHNLLRHPADALEDYDKAIEFVDGPMRVHLRAERAVTLAANKEHARSREEADILAEGKDLSEEVLYNLACVYAQSVAAAGKDAELAERYAARAVDLLRRAAGAGFRHVDFIKIYPGFAPVRSYQAFQELLKELETKKDGKSQ
jgi:tetratricopeptide (TPR) repeat protein